MADQGIRCPKCDLADKIRKVSAIVREGMVTSSGMATYVAGELGHWTSAPYSGTHISGRAKDLMPPSQPQPPSNTRRKIAHNIGYILVGLGCIGALFAFGFGREMAISVTAKDIIQFATLIIIGLVLIRLADLGYSAEKKQLQEMLSHWGDAMKKWDKLYYCERDDILFNPDDKDKRAIPVSEMTPYLYSNN